MRETTLQEHFDWLFQRASVVPPADTRVGLFSQFAEAEQARSGRATNRGAELAGVQVYRVPDAKKGSHDG